MANYTLYGHPRSGNAYKTALMLALTGTEYDFEPVDLMAGGNLAVEYLKINPLGKVPALRHGDVLLRQSHDTMRYLIEQTGQFGTDGWHDEARVGDWIGFAVDFFGYGLARLRFELLFGSGRGPIFDYFKATSDRGLGIIEPHLEANEWLVGGQPTIADIACYPVSSFLADAGYRPAEFPGLVAWQDRFRALPGFGTQLDLMPVKGWPPAA
ncbi:MAG: glutathione S-transferase [Alphaproteobacteria bacterium]|nr:glutathione S-transferase [Alphaproteobacteria bacterium]HCP00209.1 glutathione S-transferase [Rhodospirillaceae bacterium]